MCHLVFLIPLAGIPLFWILPLGYAISINILLWLVFGWIGYKAVKAMIMPTRDGYTSFIGTEVMVISVVNRRYGKYLVKAGNELWTAHSAETLQPGDIVGVKAADGIRFVVAPVIKSGRGDNR